MKLLNEMKEAGCKILEEVEEGARTLDRYYIPTRHADTFEDGSPYEYFSEKDAKRAIELVEEIIGFVQGEVQNMYKFKVKRLEEQNKLFLEAEEYIKRLKRFLGPISAAIYGYVVRGDFNIGSDIDIVVISDALAKDPLERTKVLYRCVQGREEPKGYRLDEFRKMIKRKHPTTIGIMNEGKILLDDLKVFDSL